MNPVDVIKSLRALDLLLDARAWMDAKVIVADLLGRVPRCDPLGGEVLLPCPFCGREVESDKAQGYCRTRDGKMSIAVAIYCVPCNVQMTMCRDDYPDLVPDSMLKILRHLWNCRA